MCKADTKRFVQVAQLYCYQCGGELEAERYSYIDGLLRMEHTQVECINCGFWLTGQNALAEIMAAWQEIGRA